MKNLLLFFPFLLIVNFINAQLPTFNCNDDSAYQAIEGDLRSFNVAGGIYGGNILQPINSNSDPFSNINALSYNDLDNYIYGIINGSGQAIDNNHLIRIGSNGVVEDLGTLGIAAANVKAGDIGNDTLWFKGNGVDFLSYIPGVSSYIENALANLSSFVTITSLNNFDAADFSYIDNGNSKSLYGIDNGTQNIIHINISNISSVSFTQTLISTLPVCFTCGYGATWSDKFKHLFIYNNATGVVYQIIDYETASPIADSILTGPAGVAFSDGASCHRGDPFSGYVDIDSDNDGISDSEESHADNDGDGVGDYLDIDSDNDGIYDVVEGGDGALDTNGDGVIDNNDSGYSDTNNNGMADASENTVPTNSDSDNIDDFLDTDSDDDGCNDVVEAGFSDLNNDGYLGNSSVSVNLSGKVDNAADGYTIPNDMNGNSIYDFQENGPNNASTDMRTECESLTWIDGITYTSSNNVATHTLINAIGCDSIVTLDLTINNVDNGTTNNSPTLSADLAGATYQWLECDNNFAEINGETNQSFTSLVNGNYAVEVTQNSCTDTSVCENVSNVGISEIATNINLYPNPTSDEITIDIKGYNGVINVELYDLQGRLLETTTNTIISLKKHAKGIYVLKVSYGDITEEVRIVRD